MKRLLLVMAITLPVLIIGALAILKIFFIGYFRIPQNGMFPSLPAGSHLFTHKRPYDTIEEVSRGDIIVFDHFHQTQEYTFVWRVIGLPGDSIVCSGKSVILNGPPLVQEPFHSGGSYEVFTEHVDAVSYPIAFSRHPKKLPPDFSLSVPEDHVFVLGDNRFHALDSRYNGVVAFEKIKGRKIGRP